MQRVAIVGAGAAGLATAYRLRDAPVEVTVFEKSDALAGRAATRTNRGCVYDYGANYVKSTDERIASWIERELDEGLVEAAGPVWTFDAEGTVSEGRDEDEHKWTYRSGLSTLGRRIRDAGDVTVERDTRIVTIEREEGAWTLYDDRHDPSGEFDALVLTPPAPQTASLLADARWDADRRETCRRVAAGVDYGSILTAVLHYPFALERPYYALVDASKDHAVGWISREECKPGHVPDGESVLIVQMGTDWSAEHFDADADWVAARAAEHAASLLDDERVTDPDWTDYERWRYALPETSADAGPLAAAAADDLWFAGDWVAGDGRIHAAMSSGLDAGEAIAERFD